MLVKDIFARDVTRDIAPVVYFHEQEPSKLWEEVSEYIITGGYAENDPRHTRTNQGIHEQFVRLLKAIAQDLEQPNRGMSLRAIEQIFQLSALFSLPAYHQAPCNMNL